MSILHPILVSLRHLEHLKSQFNDPVFEDAYLSGPRQSSGRPRYFNLALRAALELFQKIITQKFEGWYFGNGPGLRPSLSTYRKEIAAWDFTRKVMERRHMRRNDTEGYAYLNRIEHINPEYFVDVDETSQNPKSFEMRFGRSPRGQACVHRQVTIGTRTFSTIAAVCPAGFLCWTIHEGTISSVEFNDFLDLELAPYLTPNSWGIFDNAASTCAS